MCFFLGIGVNYSYVQKLSALSLFYEGDPVEYALEIRLYIDFFYFIYLFYLFIYLFWY